jgi:hypothetical protein
MATFTKEVLKEGNGAVPQVGQNVTVEANLYLAKDMTAIWCAGGAVPSVCLARDFCCVAIRSAGGSRLRVLGWDWPGV